MCKADPKVKPKCVPLAKQSSDRKKTGLLRRGVYYRAGQRPDPLAPRNDENTYGFHTPAGCLVATLSRFQTLMLAIAISSIASVGSS